MRYQNAYIEKRRRFVSLDRTKKVDFRVRPSEKLPCPNVRNHFRTQQVSVRPSGRIS